MEIVITGVGLYDGRYPFDLEQGFSIREWGWIKRRAGYLPATIEEGFDGSDLELSACLGAIALHRAGRIRTVEFDRAFDAICDVHSADSVIEIEDEDEIEEGDEDRPPVSNSNGSESTSGDDSMTSSERSDSTPLPSGIPDSATSRFDPTTWED